MFFWTVRILREKTKNRKFAWGKLFCQNLKFASTYNNIFTIRIIKEKIKETDTKNSKKDTKNGCKAWKKQQQHHYQQQLKQYKHPALIPRLNLPRKVPRWKWGLQNQSPVKKISRFSTCAVCIGNLSLPERNSELLMFPSEFLKFWYFPGDIAQTVFGPWLTSVSFKIYIGYKSLL